MALGGPAAHSHRSVEPSAKPFMLPYFGASPRSASDEPTDQNVGSCSSDASESIWTNSASTYSATGFSAYSPDLPGCVATGSTRSEVEENMRQAIELHLEGLRDDGEPVPSGQTIATYVEVAA